MPVFHVTITAPNGNRCSRPIIADTAENAKAEYAAERGIAFGDPCVHIDAVQQHDPDGLYERGLVDAERRRLVNEAYRWR